RPRHSGRCFTCVGPSQMARPNSYRLMNSPITRSCIGIVKLTRTIARLCSRERTIEGFELPRAPVFSLFSALNFPQGEGVWQRFFLHLTMPCWRPLHHRQCLSYAPPPCTLPGTGAELL